MPIVLTHFPFALTNIVLHWLIGFIVYKIQGTGLFIKCQARLSEWYKPITGTENKRSRSLSDT